MGKGEIELWKTCKQISRKYPLLTELFRSLGVWEETDPHLQRKREGTPMRKGSGTGASLGNTEAFWSSELQAELSLDQVVGRVVRAIILVAQDGM